MSTFSGHRKAEEEDEKSVLRSRVNMQIGRHRIWALNGLNSVGSLLFLGPVSEELIAWI